jgi:hypothetical protein
MKKNELETMIKEAVLRGVKAALKEEAQPKPRKITRSQLAEGVRKALRMTLQEMANKKEV